MFCPHPNYVIWDLLIYSNNCQALLGPQALPQGVGQPQLSPRDTSRYLSTFRTNPMQEVLVKFFLVFVLSSACKCVSLFVAFSLSPSNELIIDKFQSLGYLWKHLNEIVKYIMLKFSWYRNLIPKTSISF